MAASMIHTVHAPAAIGPYSQAVLTGGLLLTSGQLGLDPETGTLPEGIEKRTRTVAFDADNTLRMYFYLTDDDPGKYTFSIDGKEVTPVRTEAGKYCIMQKNIASGNLSGRYAFSVTDGTDTFTSQCSVLSYAYSRQEKSGSQEMVRLCKILYAYSQAADAYFQ